MDKMTAEERADYANMLDYFWCEKGDIERFTGWNADLVAKEFPAVFQAWNAYKGAERVMDAVIKSLLVP